ncbi:MAG: RNA 2',3'-cyclic phosphodiesterase [Elusimicrobiota bacterium]|nr:RNA 2',3'-cyclic phosphodiesterase [Elusimicrobiota bacterium]
MRLFIAVNIKAETKNKIVRIQSALKKNCDGVKWTLPENLHLTLKFLGEVDDSRKDLISEKLRQAVIGIKKFEIDFEKIGVYPFETAPRVLWSGVGEGKIELENLAQKIESLLTEIANLGFEKEKRSFSAHLTLGRFKSPTCSPRIHSGVSPDKRIGVNSANKKLFDIMKNITIGKISDAVESVYLMKSTLTPLGPIYEVVEKFQLEEK